MKMIHSTQSMPAVAQWALALQYIFAVFSGTLIVPMLTGLPAPMALLFSGVSTLFFHFFTRGKIPLFISCSFVFIGGTIAIRDTCVAQGTTQAMGLCYVCCGAFVTGLLYIAVGRLLHYLSYERILSFFPPVLTGSYIIALGLVMLDSTFSNIASDWVVALTTIIVIIFVQHWCRRMIRVMLINIGMLAALLVASIEGNVDFSPVSTVPWFASPFNREFMALNVFEHFDAGLLAMSVFTLTPLVIVSMVEHIADVLAISKTTKIDYMRTIGLTRTFSANGLATMVSTMFGAPPSSAFTQTTGLIGITRVCDPHLIRIASVMMIILAFCPKIGAAISCLPMASIGAVTLIMYGTVIVIGLRTLVDAKVNLSDTRNLLIASVILVLTVGIKFGLNDSVIICGINFSALAISGIVGAALNIILPKGVKS